MSDSDLRFPSDVAQELKISPSTLRRWSTEFADHLSDSAGSPELSPGGEPVHRRYADEDVKTLSSISELLSRGLTYREIAAQLERVRQGLNQEGRGNELAVTPTMAEASSALSSSFSFLGGAMERVSEGQQVVLSSQQANRDLLGIVIQDNFNLKEENSRLRERMLLLERDVSELKRREDSVHREVMERIHEIERGNPDKETETAEAEAESSPKGCLTRWFGFLF